MVEAPLEAPSSREVTLEPQSTDTKQTQEQEPEEEYEYPLSENEDLEAARVEAEKQMYIFQQPPTGPPPPLKKCLDKGKELQLQGYTHRTADGNQTTTKDKSQKQTQKENSCQDLYNVGKGKSRTEASKKAGRTKRPLDDDPNNDRDSEG